MAKQPVKVDLLFRLLARNTTQLKSLNKKMVKMGAAAPRRELAVHRRTAAREAAAPLRASWSEAQVWQELQNNIIPPPPVGKQTPMAAVLMRISAGLLAQRINVTFFPPPYADGKVSIGEINACQTAGHLWVVICNHLAHQGRLS